MNNEINNSEKYIRPEVTVYEIESEGIICVSGDGESSVNSNINPWDDGDSNDFILY